jgi:hypothetical protein
VRRVLGRLLAHLGDRPIHARALIHGSAAAGRETLGWSLQLAEMLAGELLERAPRKVSPLERQALAGALWHTVRCQVAGRRIALLAALPDYLSYVLRGTCRGTPPAQLLSELDTAGR